MKKDNNDYKKLYEQNQEHYNDLQKQRLEDYMLNDRLKKDVDLLFSTIEHQVNKLNDKIESLNDRIDNYEHDINLPNIINDLHKKNNKLNDKIHDLEYKIELYSREIPDVNQSTDYTDALNDRCDDLEAKNYQLKADFDKIAYVLHCLGYIDKDYDSDGLNDDFGLNTDNINLNNEEDK